MANFADELLVELECPVCTEYMYPPIRQCVTGHSFCDSCFNKIRKCPTCREAKGTARSFTLEKLYSKLHIPCRNRFDGCNFIDIGIKIKEHEEFCHFGEKECPLKSINNCQWTGKLTNVVGHCKHTHPNNVFVTNRQKLTCHNFLSYRNQKTCYYILFEAHDELFKCCWEVEETGMMKWCVLYMGSPVNASSFFYEVEIINQNPAKPSDENICLRGPCRAYVPENETFNYAYCLLTHFDMVKKCCNNTELVYEIRINTNSLYE